MGGAARFGADTLQPAFPASIEDSLRLLGSATGGVALFASGIVLFLRRVAFNLTVGVAVIARNT